MTKRREWYAIERVGAPAGEQEHWDRAPRDDEGVARSARLPRRPHRDGHEIWDFAAARFTTVARILRDGISQRYVSTGRPWSIEMQHLRKEMLARLLIAGVDIGDATIVHREARALKRQVNDHALTIITKAEVGDAAEIRRVVARAQVNTPTASKV